MTGSDAVIQFFFKFRLYSWYILCCTFAFVIYTCFAVYTMHTYDWRAN